MSDKIYNEELRNFGTIAMTFGLITSVYFFLKSDKLYEKLFFVACGIIQVLSLISFYLNKSQYLSILHDIGIFIIIISTIFLDSKYILYSTLSFLIITILSRLYYKKCAFYYNTDHQLNRAIDIFAILFSLLILYKLNNPNSKILVHIGSILFPLCLIIYYQ